MKCSVTTLALLMLTFLSHAQYMNTTPSASPVVLTDNFVGTGIQFTIQPTLLPNGCGTFINNGIPQIPYPNGCILSTGSIDQNPLNDTASYWNSTNFGLAGDPLLNSITVPFVTYDAQVLEFDFVAAGDSVVFELMFASEEYNEKVNQATADLFRVFLSGPGYAPNTVISVLPGTNIPVGINTVNNGPSNGTSTGPCNNCNLFIDNVGTGAVDLSFDGFTTPMVFKFKVEICESYHIRFAIADVFNGDSDSFILLKGNSFRVHNNFPIYANGIGHVASDTVYICQGGNITLSLPNGPNYNWSNGATTQSITVNQPGNYSAFMVNQQNSCFAFSNSLHIIQQGGPITTPVIAQNGTLLNPINIIPAPNLSYQWNLNGIPIPGANQSTLQVTVNGCYTMTLYDDSCFATSNEICVTNVSLQETVAGTGFPVIPHPVTEQSVIETPFGEHSITRMKLTDIAGKIIYADNQSGSTLSLSRRSIPAGLYFLSLENSGWPVTVIRKILLQ